MPTDESLKRLIHIPSVITLAVTLRMVEEPMRIVGSIVGALFGGVFVALTRRVRRPAIAAGLGTLLLLSAAAAHADVKQPKCFEDAFEGHCVAVTVNGQKTVRIAKKTKKMLKELGALSPSGGETRYEIPSPVRGALELSVDWVPEAVAYFGPQPEVSVIVFPLEGQSLDTRPELSTAPSVQVGGSAVVTQADVIQDSEKAVKLADKIQKATPQAKSMT